MITQACQSLIPFAQARDLADRISGRLESVTERVEIVGAVRRWREAVPAVELLVIPRRRQVLDLFGGTLELAPEFEAAMEGFPRLEGARGRRFEARQAPGPATLHVYLATPENWGLQLALRTGSDEFIRRYLQPAWVMAGFRLREDALWRNERPIPMRSEQALFKALGMSFVAPEHRL